MKRPQLPRVAAALVAASLIGATLALPHARAEQVVTNVNGSTQMYVLGALLTNRYHSANQDVQFSVNPNSSEFAFTSTCQGSTQIGMSDVYIQDYQLQQPNCGDMIGIPVAISAVAVVYNLPGKYFNQRTKDGFTLAHPVKMTPQLLAAIYMGSVTRWNDTAIKKLNPGMPLPSASIQAFNSSEPGGSGFVFNQWLAYSDAQWNATVGAGSLQPAWPSGYSIGQNGSAAMVQAIQGASYSLGFVGFDFAISNKLQAAAVRNASGAYHTPSLNALSVSIQQALHKNLPGHHGIPQDFRRSFVNVLGADAYDPACFEFFVVHQNLKAFNSNVVARQNIRNFLRWSVRDNGGQAYIEQIEFRKTGHATTGELAHGFIPVPDELRAAIRAKVEGINI